MARRLFSLFVLSLVPLLVHGARGQDQKSDKGPLAGRIEVEPNRESFTVRFYLRNQSKRDIEVIYGKGGSGMSVVPTFTLSSGTHYLFIHPPTYHYPPKRDMTPDKKRIPAGKEVLYGSFTMGYPPADPVLEKKARIDAVLHFEESKLTVVTEPQEFRFPNRGR